MKVANGVCRDVLTTPPLWALDNWILFMTLSSVNIRRIGALLLAAGCAKSKDTTYKQEDKSVFSYIRFKESTFQRNV